MGISPIPLIVNAPDEQGIRATSGETTAVCYTMLKRKHQILVSIISASLESWRLLLSLLKPTIKTNKASKCGVGTVRQVNLNYAIPEDCGEYDDMPV